MKRIILILLFTPLISFGQVKYKDLIQIDSKSEFLKYMFDLGFSALDDETPYSYAKEPSYREDGTYSSHFAMWNEDDNTLLMQIRRSTNNDYDRIVKTIKKKCKFLKMLEVPPNAYACYSCPESRNFIAVMVTDDSGIIKQVDFDIWRDYMIE